MAAEDPTWLQRLQRRDEAAFNELVIRHQDSVFRLLLGMLGNRAEAEDVAQEVFVSAFKAIHRFRGDSAISTWLYRVAANHGKNRIKYLARRARDSQRPLEEGLDGGSSVLAAAPTRPDQQAEGHQAEHHLQRALAALEEDQRVLIMLRDVQNLSYEEIAEVTSLPIGTVKSRLHRARLALHARYAELSESLP
ncbi:MAG: sigma-70 family RNA polymerase sigma factor [Myxococcales bacterium]|nr:sigma-70 family RNA polymerase sigma factor [Myxococcales bacterium]